MVRMSMFTTNRDMRDLLLLAHAAGWLIEKTNNNHIKLTAKSGAIVFGPSSPSDYRSVLAVRSKMNRVWPGWDKK